MGWGCLGSRCWLVDTDPSPSLWPASVCAPTQDPQHEAQGQVREDMLELDQWERDTRPIPPAWEGRLCCKGQGPGPQRPGAHCSPSQPQARRHCPS